MKINTSLRNTKRHFSITVGFNKFLQSMNNLVVHAAMIQNAVFLRQSNCILYIYTLVFTS